MPRFSSRSFFYTLDWRLLMTLFDGPLIFQIKVKVQKNHMISLFRTKRSKGHFDFSNKREQDPPSPIHSKHSSFPRIISSIACENSSTWHSKTKKRKASIEITVSCSYIWILMMMHLNQSWSVIQGRRCREVERKLASSYTCYLILTFQRNLFYRAKTSSGTSSAHEIASTPMGRGLTELLRPATGRPPGRIGG